MVRVAVVVGMLIAATGAVAGGRQDGRASWYHLPGNRTASGEMYSGSGHTCAHRSHRFGTRLRVTDLSTRRSVICRVNDYGPAEWTGRSIDLNKGAAQALGIIRRGVARVSIEVVRAP